MEIEQKVIEAIGVFKVCGSSFKRFVKSRLKAIRCDDGDQEQEFRQEYSFENLANSLDESQKKFFRTYEDATAKIDKINARFYYLSGLYDGLMIARSEGGK
jgi:hypothetical protein